jgi:hypothetical protein
MIIVLQIIMIETGIITGITILTVTAISTARGAPIGDPAKVMITTATGIAIPMTAMKATGVTVSR